LSKGRSGKNTKRNRAQYSFHCLGAHLRFRGRDHPELGRRPRAVIMMLRILEFSIDGPTMAAVNDSTGVAETNGRVLAS